MQPRCGRAQIGIAAEMKPERDYRLEAEGDLSQPGEFSLERLPPPAIVGQVDNPVLEAVRRLWWRAFDRVCGFFVVIRLLIQDCIHGPEPPTPADIQREADHERLVRTFSVAAEPIEPRKRSAGLNRDGDLGSHHRFRLKHSAKMPYQHDENFGKPHKPRGNANLFLDSQTLAPK